MRRGEYRDPAIVVEEREARTCRGCVHFIEQRLFDVSYMACKRHQEKHWQDDWKSRRCKNYDTGADLAWIKTTANKSKSF